MKKALLIAIFLTLSSGAQAAQQPSYTPSLLPITDTSYYLGSTSPARQWKGVYTSTLNVTGSGTSTNITGDVAITGGLSAGYVVTPIFTSGTCTGNGFVVDSTTFVVDCSNNKVGIGTTSPGTTLAVQGTGLIANYLTASYFNATSTTATSTFAGYVGIGTSGSLTTAPAKAEVAGDIALTSNNARLRFMRTSGANYLDYYNGQVLNIRSISATDTSGNVVASFDNNGLAIGSYANGIATAPSAGAIISGNVGIGTSSPQSRVHVVQSGTASVQISSTGSVNGSRSFLQLLNEGATQNGWDISSAVSAISTSETDFTLRNIRSNVASAALTVQGNTGNVGIGTAGPGYKLDVNSGSLRIANGTGSTYATRNESIVFNRTDFLSNFSNKITNSMSGNTFETTMNFELTDTGGTGHNTIMTLVGNGNVGIGTTSPSRTLSVHGNTLISGDITSVANVTATGTLSVYATTTPVGRIIVPMAQLSYFNMTGTTTSLNGTSDGSTNMLVLSPSTTFVNDSGFDNGGANNGRMRYTGTVRKTFHVAFTLSATPAVSNDVFVFGLAKNGTVDPSCKVIGSSSGTQFSALHCMVEMSQNDYVEVYVGNTTATRQMTLKSFNLFMLGM